MIDALDEIKVLDPACGSGAFPIGILQKMLLILQKVDPDSIEWVIRQLDKIPNLLVRKALEEKLINENWKYKHKMGIIQNAIYGVDIQAVATEISKLRHFLSLIVDESVIEALPIKTSIPLPNLSFKFVCANSLIVWVLKKPPKYAIRTLSKALITSVNATCMPILPRKKSRSGKTMPD